MGIAITLRQYLEAQGVTYDCLEHAHTSCSIRTAQACHVHADRIAKAVLLKGRDGYILAVVPASRQVMLGAVGGWLHEPVSLADEAEIAPLFPDCELGAVPPVAAAYGLRALVDENLKGLSDVYFESGDHRSLIHLSGKQFNKLMQDTPHGWFGSATGQVEDEFYLSGS